MATEGDGRATHESGGAGVKFPERPFQPDINEEPHNISQEAGRNNSTGDSELNTHEGGDFASFCATIGISELEQILKHKTFTRSEAQRLIALVHSRTMEESPSPLLRLETSTTSGSQLKKRKHGDENDNFHAAIVSSRVLEEEIASPAAELAKAYKGNTIGTGQAPRQVLKWINTNNATSTCLSKTPMASFQHPATMENLPDELLSNIFIRLLAKQLAQMRSVNKSWNALLSQPSFIKSHLSRSIHNSDKKFLVFTARLCQSIRLALASFTHPVNPQSEYTRDIRVIGSVNGLVCSFYKNDSIIQIWNPSLSARLTLPPYSTPSLDYRSVKIHFRFGYDPKTDDYRVVKLTGLIRPISYDVRWWLDVEVYSMRKGSWELIAQRFPSHITNVIDGDYVCADGRDGHLHWLCGIGEEKMDSERVVAFDLGSETFREMPLPHSIYCKCENILGVLAQQLCVMSHVRVDGRCEVWVMEEYGVAESWVKRHVFPQFVGKSVYYGFTSHNDCILVDDGGHLVLYDPNANKQKILEDRCPKEHYVQNVVEYVDSLVWVAPANHGMVDDGGQI